MPTIAARGREPMTGIVQIKTDGHRIKHPGAGL